MAASISDVLKLRRMIAEPTSTTYSDDDLEDVIESHPVLDSDGYDPEEDDWTATYDLNAAAAEIWEEKATAYIGLYDFNADGGSFNRSQAYEQAMKMARHYHSRKRVGSITLRPEPKVEAEELDSDDSN
jgi:hypothetical protein